MPLQQLPALRECRSKLCSKQNVAVCKAPLPPATSQHANFTRACAQVVRTALLDASSVSSLMMTSEAIICDAPEPPKPAGPPGGGMGGMGGYDGMY